MGRKKVIENIKPWIYNGVEINSLEDCPENAYGFIYLITSKETGKKYVGKKSLHSYKSKIVKKLNEKTGRLNKVKEVTVLESDWKNYFGSNVDLKKTIKEEGKDNFIREILRFCFSKKTLTYYELSEQCKRDVLENEEYINDNILGKFFPGDFKF